MIEQQQQQQQILNSIMIANCNKYFSHHQLSNNHPQSPSAAAAAAATKSSLVKIMSNPGVSGATNSVAAAMNNNNKAAQTANGMSSSSAAAVAAASNGMGIGSGASPVSPQPPAIANKMGSRRIFSPHFKIQVLESYRNDSDCKGNQRATARKYGIHRRQIQKWLQCETALRTSVSSNGGGARSPPTPTLCHSNNKQQVDTNNNTSGQQVKRTLGNGPKPVALSTSSNQARHSVDSNDSGAVRLAAVAEDCASVSETNTRMRLCGGGSNATHTRQISMEFFSSTTTSLIINGGAAAGGPDGGRKIESMNEAAAAAVPIKPEFCFNAAPATTSSSSPHPSSSAISRGNVEMPAAAAAMLKHQHHLHHYDLYQINGGGGAAVEEDAPHHSLISAVPTLPPFISTIYGPQSLLAFPCTFPFEYAPSVLHQHQHHLSPIDLSVGNAERRHAVDLYRRSPLIQVDDARVPSKSVSGDEVKPSQATPISPYESMTTPSAAPIDLSCSRKRKANVAEPVVKPPKLFKPYLLDDHEEEEELKVVDEEEEEQSPKEDSFLDQDLTGLKDKLGHRFEYPTAVYPHYPGASPTYDSLYFSHENLTLYPSPRHYRFDASPSSDSSPRHHPSRPASLFDSSSTNSSEAAYGNYHPGSPASSLDMRSSPPVFSGSSNWPVHEMRSRVIGSVF